MPPPGGRGRGRRRGGGSAPPPGDCGRGGGSAPPPGGRGRGRGRGGASATFEVPIFRRHQTVDFKARNSRRRRRRRGRSGPGPSEGWPQSPPCQDHVAEQTPVSCSSKLLSTLKESSTTSTSSSSPQADSLSSSPGRTILIREPPDWYLKFYIRIDLSGSYHTYPDVGGPFKSVEEAENAIDCYLGGLRHEMMCKESLDKLTPMERLVRVSLHWPDGRRRECSEAGALENTRRDTVHLLQALVDMYNDDHYLFGDLAYELKDALHYQTTWEGGNLWCNHFNFTTKAKGAGGIDNLFFAEVMEGDELTVSCFCMIDDDANGNCYGCTNNGSVGMKHPNDANTYNAGDPNAYIPFEHSGDWDASDDDENAKTEEDRVKAEEDRMKAEEYRVRHVYKAKTEEDRVKAEEDRMKAEEARVRHIYEGLDNPNYLKKFTHLVMQHLR